MQRLNRPGAPPPDATALLKSARDKLAKGDTAKARALIGAVLARWPNSVDAQAGLGMVARAEGDPVAALKAFERALKLKPGIPQLIAFRAQTLAELGRIRDAAADYDRLIAALPREVKPRADKAHMLQQAGDFDAAEREFRAALDLAPDDGELYRVFLRSKKLKAGDPLIAAMERAWAKSTLSDRSRVHLGFALAKAMEDSGQTPRVFTYLRPANEGMRRIFPFDIAERERQFDALLDAFRGYDFTRHRPTPPGEFAPIFVTGLPRSGTTLIEQIVSAHPEVTGGGEMAILFRQATDLMARDAGGYRPVAALTPAEIGELAEGYEARVRKVLDFRHRFTDKSIQTDMVAGLVRMAMPGARMILVHRDPRDTLLSIYKNVFMPGRHLYAYDLRDLVRYYRIHLKFVDFWRETLPDAFHEVHYEAVVADPGPEVRKLLQAVELPWDDACLNFTENRRQVRTLSAHQVRQPLYASSIGVWRQFEGELSEMLDELGEVS
jgi:Tfp pilus assembly protein PilF